MEGKGNFQWFLFQRRVIIATKGEMGLKWGYNMSANALYWLTHWQLLSVGKLTTLPPNCKCGNTLSEQHMWYSAVGNAHDNVYDSLSGIDPWRLLLLRSSELRRKPRIIIINIVPYLPTNITIITITVTIVIIHDRHGQQQQQQQQQQQ